MGVNAFEFTGYVWRSGNEVWLNPPFRDTVYSVPGAQVIPRYRMLDSVALTTGQSSTKNYGDDFSEEISLEEGFFSDGRYLVFPFLRNLKLQLGIYDSEKNLFMDSRNLDYLIESPTLIQTTNGLSYIFRFTNQPHPTKNTPGIFPKTGGFLRHSCTRFTRMVSFSPVRSCITPKMVLGCKTSRATSKTMPLR